MSATTRAPGPPMGLVTGLRQYWEASDFHDFLLWGQLLKELPHVKIAVIFVLRQIIGS
jgi:hypothetical protein